MPNLTSDPELDGLLAALCDDSLSAEQATRLGERLRVSEADRQAYLEYLDLHVLLLGESSFAQATEALGGMIVAEPAPRPKTKRLVLSWLAGVSGIAVVLMIVALSGHWHQQPGLPAPSGGRVVDVVGDVQTSSQNGELIAIARGESFSDGQTLRTGEDDSYAVVELADGTRFSLAPDSQVRLAGNLADRRLILSAGVIQGSAPANSRDRSLVVVTSQAEIDVGDSQFTVSAPNSRSTAVETESGSVRLTRTSDGRFADVPAGFYTVAMEEVELLPVLRIEHLPSEPFATLPLERVKLLAYSRHHLLAATANSITAFSQESNESAYPPVVIEGNWKSLATPDGRLVLRWDSDGNCERFDSRTGQSLGTFMTGIRNPASIDLSNDGKTLAVAEIRGQQSKVRLWDLSLSTELPAISLPGHARCVAFSPDSQQLAIGYLKLRGGAENRVAIWDHASSTELVSMSVPEYPLNLLKFSPDGARLAGATKRGQVYIWDSQLGHLLVSRNNSQGWSHCVSVLTFATDNTTLAVGTTNGKIRLWDTAADHELGTLTCGMRITSVAFSPDGKTLAVSAMRGPISLFRLLIPAPVDGPL